VALAASRAGAALANYVDAIEPIRERRRVIGMMVRDGVGGGRRAIKARVTINAAGGAAGRLMAAFGVRRPTPLVKAMNVVTTRAAPLVACGAPAASGRLLFTMPWHNRLSIGTWHGSEPCGADAGMVTAQELASFIQEINEAFPALKLGVDDIALVQRGIVPGTNPARPGAARRSPVDPRAPSGWRRRRDFGDGRQVHDRPRCRRNMP
jgi:glycerol-3-phosphate dehydrogenase